MKKIIDLLKKNWCPILLFLIFYTAIFYCCRNTFLISDDLHYSFYLHDGDRITNVFQIIKNQIYDYSHYNSRVLIHFFVQLLLIFGKKIWYFINPLVICIGIYYSGKIIKLKSDEKYKNIFYFIPAIISFLLLYDKKCLIYWVAGSVNYTWVYTALAIYFYYYLNGKLDKKYLLNILIILFFSTLCECSMVMMVVFVLGDILIDYFKNKKINKIKLLYFIPLLFGIMSTILSPGNIYRSGLNQEWNSLSIFEKVYISIPVVSKNLFNINSIYTLNPTFFVFSIILLLIQKKEKKYFFLFIILILNVASCYIFNNGWLYFILSILIYIIASMYFYEKRDYKYILLLTAIYANSFFVIMIDEYSTIRPSYHSYLFMGITGFIILNNLNYNKKIYHYLMSILCIILILIEINLYHDLGKVVDERMESVRDVQNRKTDTLKVKQYHDYGGIHIDVNSPSDTDYWAYKFYLKYYNLSPNTKVEVVE